MYKCRKCESFFEETELEFYTDLDTCFNGVKHTCPFCGSDDFCETRKCASCGEEFGEDDLDGEICNECKARLQAEARNFIKKYNIAEQEAILEFLSDF